MAELSITMADSTPPVEAQAVPDQPVAWMRRRAARHPDWLELCESDAAGAFPVFTRPTPAAADLHQQIMNLPCRSPQTHSGYMSAYNAGHRDARHAAAQLVAASPAAAAPSLLMLTTLRDVVRCLRETGSYSDEEGEVTDQLEGLATMLAASPAAAATQQFACQDPIRQREIAGVPTEPNAGKLARRADRLVQVLSAGREVPTESVIEALREMRDAIGCGICTYFCPACFDSVSPVAPVGAPTEEVSEIAEEYSASRYGGTADSIIAMSKEIQRLRALLSAQGCELATDATKQQREHSVHLAADDAAEDFRRRPASSEAAPSANAKGQQCKYCGDVGLACENGTQAGACLGMRADKEQQ